MDRRAEKGDYFLTDNERANIEKCAASYKNFILIINGGSQIDMAFAEEIKGINAIMFICQLGTAGGKANLGTPLAGLSLSGQNGCPAGNFLGVF